MCGNLQAWLRRNEAPFVAPGARQQHGVDLAAVYAAKSIREFDAAAVVPLCGYRDVAHYYSDASGKEYVGDARVPLLALNALDDPVCSGEAVPVHLSEANEHLIFGLTAEGGHVAWPSGLWPRHESWSDEVCLRFFEAVAAADEVDGRVASGAGCGAGGDVAL